MSAGVRLFSYGTLRQPEVQRGNFGRLLDMHEDRLPGYEVRTVTITDQRVIDLSGSVEHPVAVPSEDPQAVVDGVVLELTAAELELADAYEVDDYARVKATLASGMRAWVYALAH